MNNETLIISFIITLPMQFLVLYLIRLLVLDWIDVERKRRNSLNNLLGVDKIHVDLTEEDITLIENIIELENVSSIEELIRKEIKNLKGA